MRWLRFTLDFLTQGPIVPRFEQALVDYCGGQNGVAVNSATSALHLACLALDPLGDWSTSPNSFVASANSALYCGAKIDFVDIDPLTYNLCPEKLEQKLKQAEKKGALPKIVMPVHFADSLAICQPYILSAWSTASKLLKTPHMPSALAIVMPLITSLS